MANGDPVTAWETVKELGLVGIIFTSIYWIGYGLRGIRDELKSLDLRHEKRDKDTDAAFERNDDKHDQIDTKMDGIKDDVGALSERTARVETEVKTICKRGDE